MVLKAFINYLIGWDSTNITRIWIPTKGKVIRTRDVRFNDNKFYDLRDIELRALQTVKIELLYKEIKVPNEVYDRL